MRRAALLFLIALALAGCGGGGNSSNGEASKSAEQIAGDAEQAARSASAVHVFGSVQRAQGPLSVDMHLVKGTGAEGDMGLRGGTVHLVRLDQKVFMKGDSAFWTSIAGAAAASLLHDRWIRVPAQQKGLAAIIRFTDLDQLIGGTVGAHGAVSKKGTKTYRGQKVIVLEDSGGSGGALYVAASGKPYPLAIVSPNNGKEGAINYDQWNKAVAISAPKGALDIGQLTGGG